MAVFLIAAMPFLSRAQTAAAGTGDSVLLQIEGTVEVAKAGTTAWTAGNQNQTLKTGDRLRTGKNSRATIRLSNLSILRVRELTTLEIQPPQEAEGPPTLNLQVGAAYFFHRDKPATTNFRTPAASGAIRGTEFNLAVAEDGRMLLTLVDGEVNVQNELGALELHTGEQASVEPGKAPQKTAAVEAINVIQWILYYPAVLDPEELGLSDDLKVQLAPSLDAYRSGDLLKAVDSYPFDRESQSPEDKVYRAQLFLAVGKVDEAQMLLQNLGEGRAPALAEAIREVIAAVKNQPYDCKGERPLASQWLACSYYHQSHGDLELARQAARAAVAKSPNFGYAHERVAEMEFSFGNIANAQEALDKSLSISPRNAQALSLKGFILAAQNKIAAARDAFDQAIAIDGALGNAWLGRGLTKIKKGDAEGGRKDLETAAALEPNRAVLRSYLGKAWSQDVPFRYTANDELARKELDLAKRIDPNDPTSWLYSALMNQQRNQVNRAVSDLETSEQLNENRRIFRSKLLLDQDKAVRGANLASIYRDAGMIDYSVRTASRAVEADPANYSAHLFLSESYDSLRDPRFFNLRYESAWLNELLLANLLAPVGAGNLSQNISQQEYSKLLESDRFGIINRTEYQSQGQWTEQASQYGTVGNTTYALDADYRTSPGWRPNNDFELRYFSAKAKQQLTYKDSVFFQIESQRFTGGDLAQYYDQSQGLRQFRFEDEQTPNLFAGYHREWSPGNHSLFLFSRYEDEFDAFFKTKQVLVDERDSNGVPLRFRVLRAGETNHSELTGYSAELQQIFQTERNTLIAGGRFQTADNDTTDRTKTTGFAGSLINYSGTAETELDRESVYVYDYFQVLEPLLLTAGLTYDHLNFPANNDLTPLSTEQESKDQISPKVGIRYTPLQDTSIRFAYTRSLGGMFFDQNYRLEPSQIAGFTQTYRSLIPESVAGSIPGTEFTTYGLGLEQRFKTKTYVTVEANLLQSEAARNFALFNLNLPPVGTVGSIKTTQSQAKQRVEFEERSVTMSVNQLLGDEWAIGGRYRISDVELDELLQGYDPTLSGVPNRNVEATLHQSDLFVIYNHRCGFFARTDATWASQSNRGYTPDIPGDDFWQFHFFAGYRFPRRHAEVRVGVMNITDQDYKLNPLNFYLEYPRERTFVASLKFSF